MPYNRNTPEGREKYNKYMRVYMREYMRIIRYQEYLNRPKEEWSDEDRRRNPALVRQFANLGEYRRAKQARTDHPMQALGRLGGRPRVLPDGTVPKDAVRRHKQREISNKARYNKRRDFAVYALPPDEFNKLLRGDQA
jgi:hypothetical protein